MMDTAGCLDCCGDGTFAVVRAWSLHHETDITLIVLLVWVFLLAIAFYWFNNYIHGCHARVLELHEDVMKMCKSASGRRGVLKRS